MCDEQLGRGCGAWREQSLNWDRQPLNSWGALFLTKWGGESWLNQQQQQQHTPANIPREQLIITCSVDGTLMTEIIELSSEFGGWLLDVDVSGDFVPNRLFFLQREIVVRKVFN